MWDSVTDLIGVHLCRLAGVDANRAGKLYFVVVSYSLTRCVRRRRRTSTRVPGPTTPTPAILCWRSPDPAASSGWSTTSQCNASRWRSRLLGARTRSLQAPCTVFSFSIINVNTLIKDEFRWWRRGEAFHLLLVSSVFSKSQFRRWESDWWCI